MRVTKRRKTSFLFSAITIFAIAQSHAAYAEPRPFQMALWVYEELGSNWIPTNTDFDVAMFSEGYAQPPGRSIMQFKSWRQENVAEYLGEIDGVDWSRVLAVVIDEPYLDSSHSNPCRDAGDSRRLAAAETTRLIQNGAQALNAIAPKVRLWVNYSQHEVDWMIDAGCPMALNGAYIDVVSIDLYYVPFDEVQPYYDWFISSRPQQQVALVPGTFFRGDRGNPAALTPTYLQGYFEYANSQNQRCDLKYGRVGITGHYDGCRVWIVAGWLAGTFTQESYIYKGLLNPDSLPIATVWRNQLAIARRPQSHRLESEVVKYLLRAPP